MAKKSIFSNLKENTLKKDEVVEDSTSIDLIIKNNNEEIDLKVLYFKSCETDNEKIKERIPFILKINDFLRLEMKSGVSFNTIESYFYTFRMYIKSCDRKNINPFNKEGYISYVGNNGELRRLIKEANNRKQYLFMYEDNESIGIKESTANSRKLYIEKILSTLSLFREDWNFNVSKFKSETNEITETPYTDNELKTILNRVQKYFYQLGDEILKSIKENGEQPDSVDISILNETITVSERAKGKLKRTPVNTPFNQFMGAGYTLLAFYTSFNDSSILDLKHPIEIKSSKKEGRVLRHATITAWKGRKKDYVSSVISDDFTEFLELDKKSGLDCLNLLVKVSKACGANDNDSLFYALNNRNEKSKLDMDRILAKMSLNLNLTSENKKLLLDYFIELFYLTTKERKSVKVYEKNTKSGKVVKKDYFDIPNPTVKIRGTKLSYLILDILFGVDLKNSIMPITFGEEKNGLINLTLSYEDKAKKEIVIEERYKKIIEDIQEYSCIYNTYKLTKQGKYSIKTPYLIPFGFKGNTKQWDGLQPIQYQFLNELGVNSGGYFLSINSRKMRLTNSNSIYKNHSGSVTGKILLDHSQKTHDKHYSNGDSKENEVMLFEGMNILNEIAKGNTKKEAIDIVKSKLNIEVLSFEDYKKKKMPTNLNGLLCSGKEPDLIEGKNEHNVAKKNADKLGFEGLDINCYQYDLCILCKNAKLVDDVHSVYKLVSFIDCLEEAADLHIEMSSEIMEKADRFKVILETNISQSTIMKARQKMDQEGRYRLLKNPDSVYQYI